MKAPASFVSDVGMGKAGTAAGDIEYSSAREARNPLESEDEKPALLCAGPEASRREGEESSCIASVSSDSDDRVMTHRANRTEESMWVRKPFVRH